MLSAQGQRLRQLILKNGYTIKPFAPLIGERPDEMSRIFKHTHIDMEILRRSAQKLGVQVSDITGASEDANPQPESQFPAPPESPIETFLRSENDYLRDELSKAHDIIASLVATVQNLSAKK